MGHKLLRQSHISLLERAEAWFSGTMPGWGGGASMTATGRMRKAGRDVMSAADYDHSVHVTAYILTKFGFDVAGWATRAGGPRNEPEPPARKPSKRRAKQAPVQLSFPF